MKVQFEFAPIPRPKGSKKGLRYYPRIVNRHLVETEEITEEIQMACSLTEGDVVAVLKALSHSLSTYLMKGERVHLEGIGYFDVKLTCPETANPKKTRASSVKYGGINFLPDKELKYVVGNLEAQRARVGGNHSAKLSETAIDMRLTEFFEENTMLTRQKMQSVCNMTRTTALRHLKRLVSEGKLQNISIPSQPIYVPVPGHYHVSVDRK